MRPARAAVLLAAAVVCAPLCAAAPSACAEAADKAAADAIDAATKDASRRLGFPLRVAVRGRFIVRGDSLQSDLDILAESCRSTFEHYVDVMGCEPDDVVKPARKGEPAWVEVFQFEREKGYLDYLDKVYSRVRDDTVDDRRFALMHRQRGMFVLTPHPIIAQYRGPSDTSTVRSQVVHKTSHVLLLSHRKAGAWMPWWFLEGFATWQEMAVLKESRTYCLEVERPGDYAKAGTPEADEAAKARMADTWRKKVREMVAARRHRDLAALAKLSLNELTFDDVMQSWSVVDWIFRQKRLPQFVKAYKDEREFAAACEAAIGPPPAGVEERWRKWVQTPE